MKRKKRKSKSGMIAKYRAMSTKGNIKNTGIKSVLDLVLGATLGAGIGASSGRMALPIGLVLIAGSHYMAEETGVVRLAGAATIAYGIGKAIHNKQVAEDNAVNGITLAGEASKAKSRLSAFKDELITAFFLDKVLKKDEDAGAEIGAIDLSSLDVFEQSNHSEAMAFEMDQEALPEAVNDEDDFVEDLDYELEPEIDLTTI